MDCSLLKFDCCVQWVNFSEGESRMAHRPLKNGESETNMAQKLPSRSFELKEY